MELEHHQALPISKSELINIKPPVHEHPAITTSEVHHKPKPLELVKAKFLQRDKEAVKLISQQLKAVKRRIDAEFNEFSQRLLNLMRNAHLIKYASRTSEDVSGIIYGTESNEQLLQQMAEHPVRADTFVEAFENCKYELGLSEQKERLVNYLDVCPTGWSLVQRFQSTIDKYFKIEPLAPDQDDEPPKVPPIFTVVSPTFSEDEYRSIESLLEQTGHKLKKVTLIFRASQHSFRSKAFKEICSKMERTMVVVKSSQRKVFGGYTPCRWLDTKQKEYIADTKRQSFLFSVDEHMVFPIRAHQIDYAISTYGSWGPIFGSPYGPDLSLADQCHLNDHSCSSLGSHYQIPLSVKEFSNEAFCLLAGSKKFKVLEYQVFEVEFQ